MQFRAPKIPVLRNVLQLEFLTGIFSHLYRRVFCSVIELRTIQEQESPSG